MKRSRGSCLSSVWPEMCWTIISWEASSTRRRIWLGHTGCGAVAAALEGSHDGYIAYITEDIREAIGEEKDPVRASELNVLHGVERIREEFALHPEIAGLEVRGAMYDIRTGEVKWL